MTSTSSLVILACLFVLVLLHEVLGAWIFLRDPEVRRQARQNLLRLLARFRFTGRWFLASLLVLGALTHLVLSEAQGQPSLARCETVCRDLGMVCAENGSSSSVLDGPCTCKDPKAGTTLVVE